MLASFRQELITAKALVDSFLGDRSGIQNDIAEMERVAVLRLSKRAIDDLHEGIIIVVQVAESIHEEAALAQQQLSVA